MNLEDMEHETARDRLAVFVVLQTNELVVSGKHVLSLVQKVSTDEIVV
ncbi:MAG: hypothetical protein AB7O73_05145 [Bacteroidia bacterium]